jgi:RNA polymerase sigma-70 factor (ECF subfamily)
MKRWRRQPEACAYDPGVAMKDPRDRDALYGHDVSQPPSGWSGDPDALTKMMPALYAELRRIAGAQMRHERHSHTLQPTALVHEVYLRLVDQATVSWRDRAHLLGVAARVMRQILVDHARRRNTDKRGGGETSVSIEEATIASVAPTLDVLEFDLALKRLAALDEREARLVELRVFSGLTIEESAEVLGCSHATVSRAWRHAQAWLRREMAGQSPVT